MDLIIQRRRPRWGYAVATLAIAILPLALAKINHFVWNVRDAADDRQTRFQPEIVFFLGHMMMPFIFGQVDLVLV